MLTGSYAEKFVLSQLKESDWVKFCQCRLFFVWIFCCTKRKVFTQFFFTENGTWKGTMEGDFSNTEMKVFVMATRVVIASTKRQTDFFVPKFLPNSKVYIFWTFVAWILSFQIKNLKLPQFVFGHMLFLSGTGWQIPTTERSVDYSVRRRLMEYHIRSVL